MVDRDLARTTLVPSMLPTSASSLNRPSSILPYVPTESGSPPGGRAKKRAPQKRILLSPHHEERILFAGSRRHLHAPRLRALLDPQSSMTSNGRISVIRASRPSLVTPAFARSMPSQSDSSSLLSLVFRFPRISTIRRSGRWLRSCDFRRRLPVATIALLGGPQRLWSFAGWLTKTSLASSRFEIAPIVSPAGSCVGRLSYCGQRDLLPVGQCAFDFLREESLVADLGERRIEYLVTESLDDHQIH